MAAISVRMVLTENEKKTVECEADKLGLSVSSYLRMIWKNARVEVQASTPAVDSPRESVKNSACEIRS